PLHDALPSYTDVLTGLEVGGLVLVPRLEGEGDGVGCLLRTLGDLPGSPDITAGGSGLGVQTSFHRDEAAGHEPVHLVPGGNHLGGGRIAEGVGNGTEEVLVHDHVLVLCDTEGDVFVRDA